MVKRISFRKLIRAIDMYFPGLISILHSNEGSQYVTNKNGKQILAQTNFMDRTMVGCDIADYESFFHRNLMLIHFSIVVQAVIVHEKFGILVLLFPTMKASDQKVCSVLKPPC